MSVKLTKWRVKCNDEGCAKIIVTHGSAPTVCPDSAGHTISDVVSLGAYSYTLPISNVDESLEETLDEMKTRLSMECKDWRNYKLEVVLTAEYPAASGKLFGVGFIDQHNWHALTTIRNDTSLVTYPYRIRTKDETQYHDLADAADVKAAWEAVVGVAKPEIDSCREAIGNIKDAVDATAAQAARDAYYGT